MSNTPREPDNLPHLPTEDVTDTGSRAIEATDHEPAPSEDQLTRFPTPGSSSSGTALQIIGGYVVVKKIGEGGMGSVYLAEDPKLGRKVAIKTIRHEFAANASDRERFLREARAAAAVEHDNIVPIWGVGEATDGTPFIVMPFLQGEMLDARLRREPVAGPGRILKVAREVADGLAAAHAKGLIHRDIKPSNIWIEGDLASSDLAQQFRRCKILDFGLARSVDKEDAQITASGAILGTPAYMAPEQAKGEKVDHRADLFSLGVALYRMATGKLPFDRPTSMAMLIALTTEAPVPTRTANPGVPRPLADLIDRLMSKDPAARPQSAAEVSATVKQIIKGSQNTKAPSAAVPPVQVVVLPNVVEPSGSQPWVLPIDPAPMWEEVTEPEPASEESEPESPKNRAPKAAARKAAPRSKVPFYIAGAVLGVLALIALAVVVLRVETAEGTLVVEINDPNVEARIKNGKLILVGADGKERYTITAADRNKKIAVGEYKVRVEGADGLVLDTTEFTLKKGGQVTVRVTLDPKAVAKKPGPVPPEKPADGYVVQFKPGAPKSPHSPRFTPVGTEVKLSPAELPKLAGTDHLTGRVLLGSPAARGDGQLVALARSQAGSPYDLLFIDSNRDGSLADEKPISTVPKFAQEMWWSEFEITFKVNHAIKGADPRLVDYPVVFFARVEKPDQQPKLYYTRSGYMLGSVKIDGAEYTVVVCDFNNDGVLGVGDRWAIYPPESAPLDHKDWLQLPDICVAGGKGWKLELEGTDGAAGRVLPVPSDRKAAESVLGIGGMVRANGGGDIKSVKDLPQEPLWLTGVNLSGNNRVTDATLATLANSKQLTSLSLAELPQVSEAGLANFKGCKDLEFLMIGAGDGSQKFSDAGLALFEDCKDIRFLWLGGTQVTDAGLATLRTRTNLLDLRLGRTSVSDVGLAHLKECKGLVYLWIPETKVTAMGVADFAKVMPQCKIEWDGDTIEPTKK